MPDSPTNPHVYEAHEVPFVPERLVSPTERLSLSVASILVNTCRDCPTCGAAIETSATNAEFECHDVIFDERGHGGASPYVCESCDSRFSILVEEKIGPIHMSKVVDQYAANGYVFVEFAEQDGYLAFNPSCIYIDELTDEHQTNKLHNL